MRNIKGFTRIASLALLALFLTSCGVRETGGLSFSAAPAAPAATASAAKSELLLPILLQEGDLDPVRDASLWNQGFYQLIYDSPIQLDASGKPSAGLAIRWESDNGRDWVFTLREGVAFHDGVPMTAGDVVRSYQALLSSDAAAAYRAMLEPISSMEALDGAVRVRAKQSGLGILYAMTFPVLGQAEQEGLPVGTGPWMIERNSAGQECVLTVNTQWYRRTARIPTIRGIPTTSEEQALGALSLGELTAAPIFKQVSSTIVEGAGGKLIQIATRQFEFLAPNLRSPLLSRHEVRDAIARSIDVQAIIAQRLEGQAVESETPIHPASWLYDPATPAYTYQMELAHQVLAEAGWTRGQDGFYFRTTADEGLARREELSFRLLTNEDPISPTRRESARYIAEMLGKAGMKVEVVALGWDEYQAALASEDFDLALVGLTIDRTSDISPLLSTEGARNIMGLSSPEIDDLVRRAAEATEETAVLAAYSELQRAIARDLPIIGLYFKNGFLAYYPRLSGVASSSQDALYYRADTWEFN